MAGSVEFDLLAYEQWQQGIIKSLGSHSFTTYLEIQPTTKFSRQVFDDDPMFAVNRLAEYLTAFAKLYMGGESGMLIRRFDEHAKQGTTYFPKFLEKNPDTGRFEQFTLGRDHKLRSGITLDGHIPDNARGASTVDLQSGFARLRKGLKYPSDPVLVNSNVVHVGLGSIPELLSLKLSSYTGGGGRTTLNSLFYAVEYGTGVSTNVGGDQWVRRKGMAGAIHKTATGKWWFGKTRLFIGQKGFHFLYESGSRRPIGDYQAFVEKELPKYLDKRFGKDVKVR